MIQSQLLTAEQQYILQSALAKQIEKNKKIFRRKRKNHFHDEQLKKIFESNKVEFSDKLFTIPFKCYFSFYLYLILKNRVKTLDWCVLPNNFRIAISQDFNINQLSKEVGICRNVIRKAFHELLKFKLIDLTDYANSVHKSCKPCIVYNDYYIYAYDSTLGHVTYTTKIPFNFNNKIYERD